MGLTPLSPKQYFFAFTQTRRQGKVPQLSWTYVIKVSDLSDDHFSHAKKLTYEHKIAIFSVTKHLFFLQKDKTPCPSLLRENKIDTLYITFFIIKPHSETQRDRDHLSHVSSNRICQTHQVPISPISQTIKPPNGPWFFDWAMTLIYKWQASEMAWEN
jgi:hypothetical protein